MSQITLLFPGQGAQFTGMGQDLCQAYPEAKAVFDLGSQVTGRDLAALCFEAVSYTHLDVYKRQEGGRCSRLPCPPGGR